MEFTPEDSTKKAPPLLDAVQLLNDNCENSNVESRTVATSDQSILKQPPLPPEARELLNILWSSLYEQLVIVP